MQVHSFCLESNHSYPIDNLYSLESAQFTPISIGQHDGVHVLLSSPNESLISEANRYVLQNNPIKFMVTINSPNLDALFHAGIKASLSKLAEEYAIDIKLPSCPSSEPEIQLLGSIDAIELARVQVLCQMDQLCGLHKETIETIPYFLHNLMAGRKHTQLQSIMEETTTNIYLQSPFSHVCQERQTDDGLVCITGPSDSETARAKELLIKLSAQKLKSFYQKDLTMAANKIDWLLLFRRSQLKKIMMDNGSFFSFPTLGAGTNLISVYAENRVNVERSIRLLNQLITTLYDASFELVPKNLKDVNIPLCLGKLSQSTGIAASYFGNNHALRLFGTEKQVKHAYQLLVKLPFFKESQKLTRFQLELATEQLEFISGKKNGKINKIMKTCAVNIRFTTVNEYNSSIVIESPHHKSAFEGLLLLQDELPAEVSFYVPEIYHRRIIGVGGKNIQKVMKKYGVYVKFSGAEELAALGGYFENQDNVVARTPMKNQINLENLKQTVTDFIGFEKDKNFMVQPLTVPFALQRTLLHQHGSEIRDMCRSHNVKIQWPERLGTSQVELYGPQSHLSAVASFLLPLIKIEQHVVIECTKELERAVAKDLRSQLRAKLEGLSDACLMDIVIWHRHQSNSVASKRLEFVWMDHFGESVIVFRIACNLASKQTLEKARDVIQSTLEANKLPFKELGSSTATVDSFEDHTPSDTTTSHSQEASDLEKVSCSQPSCFDPTTHLLDTPHTKSFCLTTNSFLSMPTHHHRNIWASEIPSSQASLSMLPVDSMRLEHVKNPFIFASAQHLFGPLSDESVAHPQQPRLKSSVPTIGTRQQDPYHEQYHSQPQYPRRHSSWPDIFLGGRDLFDALPSRRASSITTTQYAFEHQPNSCSLLQHQEKSHPLVPSNPLMHKNTMMLSAMNAIEPRHQDPSGYNL